MSECIKTVPDSVSEAIIILAESLSLKDKVVIANKAYGELGSIRTTMEFYIRTNFELWNNKKLMMSCMKVSGIKDINSDIASAVIIEELRKLLYESHRIRIVD